MPSQAQDRNVNTVQALELWRLQGLHLSVRRCVHARDREMRTPAKLFLRNALRTARRTLGSFVRP